MQLLLPADFREEHRQIVLAYLLRGHEFKRDEWRRAVLVLLKEIAATLPQAARIVHQGLELTVIDYETWKEKVRRQQEKERKNDEPAND